MSQGNHPSSARRRQPGRARAALASRIQGSELTAIDGIGPKVAERLAQSGIMTISKLAETSEAELSEILRGLPGRFTVKRITDARWREQAVALAAHEAPTRQAQPEDRHHAVPRLGTVRHNFTVEATIDAANGAVVASHIDHIQSRDQMSWQWWERKSLLEFMEERMGAPSKGWAEKGAGPSRTTEGAAAPGSLTAPKLHAFAMVPQPALRCEQGGAVRAKISFDCNGVTFDPIDGARVRVRVFLRRDKLTKAELVGSADAPVGDARMNLVVPCQIPKGAVRARSSRSWSFTRRWRLVRPRHRYLT